MRIDINSPFIPDPNQTIGISWGQHNLKNNNKGATTLSQFLLLIQHQKHQQGCDNSFPVFAIDSTAKTTSRERQLFPRLFSKIFFSCFIVMDLSQIIWVFGDCPFI